jgi:hypothetical protein
MFNRNRNIRYIAIFALVLVLAGATYAFAAANTVPTSKAGDGSGAISGYQVGNIHYILNAVNPATIDTVTFTLDTAPTVGTIKIKLNTIWYSCPISGTTSITCSTIGELVSTATNLQVVIAQ